MPVTLQSTVTIVTPSLNQARFLPECLASVRTQNHPPLEHLVYDPGSTDGSIQIASAAPNVTLFAESDEGQAHAVNKGMLAARGEIIGWLNSDDAYSDSDVLSTVLERFAQPDAPDIVYGRGMYVDEQGKELREAFINTRPETLSQRFKQQVGLLQPATFFRRDVVARIGALDQTLHFCMDYEYWIRAMQSGLKFAFLDRRLAKARYYPANKTFGQRGRSLKEVCACLKRKFGFVHPFWIRALAEFNVEGFDGILSNSGNRTVRSPDRLADEETRLAWAYNGDFDSLEVLKRAPDGSPERTTLAFMRERGLSLNKPVSLLPARQESGSLLPPASVSAGHEQRVVGERTWRYDRAWLTRQYARARAGLEGIRAARDKDQCIIVGNGPSLARVDRSLLEGQDLFISNFAFKDEALLRNTKVLSVVNYLVAEQGSHEFNLLENVTKVFPSFLAYCLNEGDRTFFLPSRGVPEFSRDPFRNVSWRSTVTFFHLQIAYWLGYRKAIMIGFDHSYKQDARAVEGDILVCDGRDENHFRSDYFRGMRWQAADVANMEAVYSLAKAAYEEDGREIVNCSVVGKLELFRRGDLAAELGVKAGAARGAPVPRRGGGPSEASPRLLVVDLTGYGGFAATARIKETFFGAWPYDRIRFVHLASGRLRFCGMHEADAIRESGEDEVMAAVSAYAPEVIYYRAVDNEVVHLFALRLAREEHAPFVLHIMDDWPERLRRKDPERHARLDEGLRFMLRGAAARLAISAPMASAFGTRYGIPFEILANGIDPADFPEVRAESKPVPYVIRYSGAIAEDMTAASIWDVADAVEELSSEIAIRLEIYTRSPWKEAALERTSGLAAVSIHDQVPAEDYVRLLQGAGALLIAYNFDEESLAYIRYSMANKLPEYLASGTPVLAYGPPEAATIAHLKELGCAQLVESRSPTALKRALRELATSDEIRQRLGRLGRGVALERHDMLAVREGMRVLLQSASGMPRRVLLGPFPRSRRAHCDETAALFALMSRNPSAGSMVDVGAHHGSSFMPFFRAGWQVYAFEPDEKNRRKLQERVSSQDGGGRLKLDSRAVSDRVAQAIPFYRSEQSSGISGLSSFHPSHREAQRVDTVTLTAFLKDEPLEQLDFLKIDTEGHDLFVLRGFPWERFRPGVIECEFEDAKTVPLGYDFHTLAGYLVDKGYTVYVSEWHPVLRYGIRHDWNRLIRYPCELADEKAWGNLLAFRDPVDEAELVAGVRRHLNVETTAAQSRSRSRTLVILGNGPSLRNFDFNRLRSFDVVGMNAAYRYWDRIGWYPRYYACLDQVVGLSHKDEIARLIRGRASYGIDLFLLRRNLIDSLPMELGSLDCVLDFDALRVTSELFAPGPISTGSHAALFGAYLGYNRMVLLGIDANYVEKVAGAEERGGSVLELTETPGRNPNYFFDDYQIAGDRFNLPNPLPDMHLNSWRAAASVLASRSVSVWNANPQSRVAAFPFRDFAEIEREDSVLRKHSGKEQTGGRAEEPGWNTYHWTTGATRASLSLPINRSRDLLLVVACKFPVALDRRRLHVELDGVVTAHQVYEDVHPACIVVRVPAGERRGRSIVEFAVVSSSSGEPLATAGPVETHFPGLRGAARVAMVPARPCLPLRFSPSVIDRLRQRFGLPPGDEAGEFPLSHFDGLAYLRANADVAEAVLSGRMESATEHYRIHGCKEGRWFTVATAGKPNKGDVNEIFNGLAYLQAHPDVANGVRSGAIASALDHFLQHGRSEGRPAAMRLDGMACRGTAVDLVRLELDKLQSDMNVLKGQVASQKKELLSRVESLSEKMAGTRQELNVVKRQADSAATKLSSTGLGTFNVLGYQSHPRALSRQSAERLVTHWAPMLGVTLTEKEVYYLAHRVGSLEAACIGRLASSVDDMILRVLVAMSVNGRGPRILEIGTLFGMSVGIIHEALLSVAEKFHATVIDPLDGFYGRDNRDVLTGVGVTRRVFEENLRRMGIGGEKVTLIQHLSTDPAAAKMAAESAYDMLVIDGDHRYAGVKHDAEVYAKLVRPGGYVIFDDYGSRFWPGVQQYVDSEARPRADLEYVGAEWHTAVFRVREQGKR